MCHWTHLEAEQLQIVSFRRGWRHKTEIKERQNWTGTHQTDTESRTVLVSNCWV